MWEGVGDQTELQHIDPRSIGHNRVSFLFSWAAQPGAQPLWVLVFSTTSYLKLVWSPNWSDLQTDWISCALSYIIVHAHLLLVGVTISHSFNLSMVKVILSWSTGCTCHLHRCIFYFDSLAGLSCKPILFHIYYVYIYQHTFTYKLTYTYIHTSIHTWLYKKY